MVRSSSVRTVSRNPRRRRSHAAVLVAKRGSETLYYDGRHFTARGKRKFFGSLMAAYAKGEQLLKRYPILRTYRLFAKPL